MGYTTTMVYAPAQRAVTVRDALNNASTTVYDSLGRTLTVTDPLGTTVAYTCDANGNTLSVVGTSGSSTLNHNHQTILKIIYYTQLDKNPMR